MFCEKCRKQINDTAFCPFCGEKRGYEETRKQNLNTNFQNINNKPLNKKSSKKVKIIVFIVIALLIIASVLCGILAPVILKYLRG